jgi:hypothetical protein
MQYSPSRLETQQFIVVSQKNESDLSIHRCQRLHIEKLRVAFTSRKP